MKRFTRLSLRILLPALVVSLLAACAGAPKKAATTDPTAGSETPLSAGGAADLPDYVQAAPVQNPYLQQAVDAPGAARELFATAVTAMQDEDWRKAEILLQQLTTEYPTLSGPFLNLGIVYRKMDNDSAAEQAFLNAITANALNLDAYNQLALLKREAGEFEAAKDLYLKAIEVWPRHGPSHRNLGILYDLYTGDWAKALEHFEIYQNLQPEPDRLTAGWIIDLQRRMEQRQQAEAQ